jgi:hypothetical protein
MFSLVTADVAVLGRAVVGGENKFLETLERGEKMTFSSCGWRSDVGGGETLSSR